ncbi:ferredoxin [Antrihabitans sp. YC2-6]|uniref:ferredoxin n=1 Tax=Antrihabitans sp. YC2-6 TaxID=2799498 RepID=UPI0018F4D512|nr:ferredoxin [Antrihabitans sp. YC2-6]MBJ8344273.1 ferredoxin [Antrihabitans sp. YC2-6]
MRVFVDRDRCEAHGMCTLQAPTVFALDDEGELVTEFESADLPSELEAEVDSAVDACPVAALRAR